MIHIVTDSTACLPADLARRYSIPIVPQIVLFGDDSYQEGVDIDNATFLQRLRTSKQLPKTAAPPPGLFESIFQERARAGDTIFCIHPSSEVSGTVRSALTAAADFAGSDIRVVDTRTIAGPLCTLVVAAAQWAEAGQDADRIVAGLNAMIPRAHIYFLVDTLEYLQKGGRIGGAQALIGGLLQVKPLLEMCNGRIEPLERERTHKRALARLKELVIARAAPGEEARIAVLHADASDTAHALAADLAKLMGIELPPVMDVPPAIVTHAGPGLLGVGFFSAESRGNS